MQTNRMGQAAAVLFILATAAGCAATKEYSSKLFSVPIPKIVDDNARAPRFLQLEILDNEPEDWVSTDLIMGRDTARTTRALDKLTANYPATPTQKDSSLNTSPTLPAPLVSAKKDPSSSEPVAKYLPQGEVRSKRTRE